MTEIQGKICGNFQGLHYRYRRLSDKSGQQRQKNYAGGTARRTARY